MKLGPLLPGAFLCAFIPMLADAAPLGGGQSPDINLVRIGLSLALCLIVAAAAILVLRRKGGAISWLALPADTRAIAVKETRRISLHADLCRFECDGQEFLVVVTPQSATLLRERQIAPPASP